MGVRRFAGEESRAAAQGSQMVLGGGQGDGTRERHDRRRERQLAVIGELTRGCPEELLFKFGGF